MSKSSKAHDRRSSKRSKPTQRSNDGGVYIGLVMIGGFGMLLWWAASSDTWRQGLVGYLVAVALLVNFSAIKAYLGKDLSGFQRALAHLPLRCVGYGTRKGRPLQQARGAANALGMIVVCLVTSVVVLVLLGWLLLY